MSAQDASRGPDKLIWSLRELLDRKPPEWLVEDLIVQRSLTVLFGGPAVGKSFLAINLAACIATGRPWLGRTVLKGPVVYVAAEGADGLTMRLAAWSGGSLDADSPLMPAFRVIPSPLDLLGSGVDRIVAHLKATPKELWPVLIIIDTLARCNTGDENSSKDMGDVIRACDKLRDLGASVLLVHHAGKERGDERGSSALRGAADTVMRMTRVDEVMTVECDKQKDANEFKSISLRLTKVPLEMRRGGKELISCRVDSLDDSPGTVVEGSARPAEDEVLRLLESLDEAVSARRIAELTAISGTTLTRRLRDLQDTGYVTKEKKGRNVLYRLTSKTGSDGPKTSETGVLGGARSKPTTPPPLRGGAVGLDRSAPAGPGAARPQAELGGEAEGLGTSSEPRRDDVFSKVQPGAEGSKTPRRAAEGSLLEEATRSPGALGSAAAEVDAEALEERLAIQEIDGGLSREEAERLASESEGPPS